MDYSPRVLEEPPQTPHTETSKPTRANSTHTADHHQKDSETSGCESDHGETSSTPLGGCVSIVSTTGARPYAHVENPVSMGPEAEIEAYLDLRCKPFGPGSPDWDKRIKVGSQIVFIGSTRWSNEKGEGVYDVGIPYGTQCYVARIFNDYWALCLKLERGIEPYVGDQISRLFDRFRRSRPPKTVEQNGKSFIALKNHPVVAIYAPLCAFTIAANYGPFEERREAARARTTGLSTWEGGIIQAASRGASSVFEEEAKRAWKVFVPLQVWDQYTSFCSESQQTTDALGNIVSAENAPSGWAVANQDLSTRGKENISTGRQLRSLISKSGTVKAVKNTANRMKSVFEPEEAATDVSSNQRVTHPVHGTSSGLAPERSNVIPPIEHQPPLRPFDDGQFSEIEHPLLSISPNVLSNPDLLMPEILENGQVAQQSRNNRNNQPEAVDTVQPSSGESSWGGPIQLEPHPGVEVSALAGLHPGIDFVRVGTSPGSHEYRAISIIEPPRPQGDIVPVHNPPENTDKKTPPAPASLPLRLKKAIQGKAGKVFLKGVQGSLANAMKSIQSRRRPHPTPTPTPRICISQATPETTTSQATPPRAMTPEGSLPQEKSHRRRNTIQNVISDAWKNIQSDRRSHSTTPQAMTPEPGEATQHSVPESNQPETSVQVQPDQMDPNPRPQHRPLPEVRGLSDHLRNVSPNSGVGRRVRSSGVYSSSF